MFFLRLIARLPFPLLYVLSDIIYLLAYFVIGYRKRVVLENLRRAFPEKTGAELHSIARQFYRNLADILVETVKVLSVSREELRARVRIRNPELCLTYLQNQQSVIVMAAHQGNWEWLLLSNAIQLGFDVDAVYKPLRSKFSDHLMQQIRSRFGPYPVPMNRLSRELVSRKKITRIIAMVADQAPEPATAYWTTFFHQETPFYTGAAKIAQRAGHPILFTQMRRIRRGYYETEFILIAEPPYHAMPAETIIEQYAWAVEKSIGAQPADWLWSHKRWKYKRPSA